ncbi:hypothetical protein [Maricaulis parjimensis]|uniref:hypothetical protein n=1 Tax=Maricaulis parjimensis TaxID=144023 RepID=UPI00193A0DCA|nr:hypothetical protein [Maricaulis parjimensis]
MTQSEMVMNTWTQIAGWTNQYSPNRRSGHDYGPTYIPVGLMRPNPDRLEAFGFKHFFIPYQKDTWQVSHQWMDRSAEGENADDAYKYWSKAEGLGPDRDKPLSDPILRDPRFMTVGYKSNGALEAFVAIGGTVYHSWSDSGSATGWAEWTKLKYLGGHISKVQVVSNQDGRLEIFAKVDAVDIYHAFAGPGGWTDWSPMHAGGGVAYDWTVGTNGDGRLELFFIDGGGMVWHKYQNTPNGVWSDWHQLGDPNVDLGTAALTTVTDAQGHIHLFVATGRDENCVKINVQNSGETGWTGWQSPNPKITADTVLHPTIRPLSAARHPVTGSLYLAVVADNNVKLHYLVDGSTDWKMQDNVKLPKPPVASPPTLTATQDGIALLARSTPEVDRIDSDFVWFIPAVGD